MADEQGDGVFSNAFFDQSGTGSGNIIFKAIAVGSLAVGSLMMFKHFTNKSEIRAANGQRRSAFTLDRANGMYSGFKDAKGMWDTFQALIVGAVNSKFPSFKSKYPNWANSFDNFLDNVDTLLVWWLKRRSGSSRSGQ